MWFADDQICHGFMISKRAQPGLRHVTSWPIPFISQLFMCLPGCTALSPHTQRFSVSSHCAEQRESTRVHSVHDGLSPSAPDVVRSAPGVALPGTHRFRSSLQRCGIGCSHESPP